MSIPNLNNSFLIQNPFYKKKRELFNTSNLQNYDNVLLNDIVYCYNNNNFQKIVDYIHKFDKKVKIFMTPDTKQILNKFNNIITIKNFIKKYFKLNRYKKIKRKWNIFNNCDLLLNDIDENNCLEIRDYDKKILYRFNCYELIHIFKHSLFSYLNNYSYPEFKQPCNPYNNEKFSLKDNLLIYKKILNYYCKQNKCIPEDIVKFKNSYFDTQLMFNNYKAHFFNRSCNLFVNKMSPERFKHELLCYIITNIKSNSKYANLYCKKCYQNTDPLMLLKFFRKVLVLDELNSNFIFLYGQSIDLFLKQYKIYQTNICCMVSHRKKKKKVISRRRRRLTNLNSNVMNIDIFPPALDNSFFEIEVINEIETEIIV
jgi:hypothetical protein